MSHAISLNFFSPNKKPLWLRGLFYTLDRLLGIKKLDEMYQAEQMQGLSKEEFALKLIKTLDLQIDGVDELINSIPKTGPLVMASNHPFGGIEGVFLAWAIGQVRPDLKILVNQGLKVFPELKDYFIFTNPLRENDPKNIASLRLALKHVKENKALLIFPAGRVSYYRKDKGRISEHKWNKIVGRLAKISGVQYLPIFVEGKNSSLFYFLGRIYYRFRLLMLARELLNKKGKRVSVSSGSVMTSDDFNHAINSEECAQLCRTLSYTQDPHWKYQWSTNQEQILKPIADETPGEILLNELEALPENQNLVSHKNFSVYFCYKKQAPQVIHEISRLREIVFRQHDEGSGEPIDTDHFDDTYIHLLLFDKDKKKIAGAYRLGATDRLLSNGGLKSLYLNQMFEFKKTFVNQKQDCLEMGRSFLTPEYQKSYQGLYMLWKGIGAFLCQFPKYKTLYGTVSISKEYSPKSVAIIKEALVNENKSVLARKEFEFQAHPEIQDFNKDYCLRDNIQTFISAIEPDNKGVPILLRHYMGLGAKFHCLGLDPNFNETPGLLLSVDVSDIPEKTLKFYMGKGYQSYKSQIND